MRFEERKRSAGGIRDNGNEATKHEGTIFGWFGEFGFWDGAMV